MARGYSLTELLVAVVIVGVGTLGAAGLQLASSQNTRSALERTTATVFAQDMAERLRANPAADYVGVDEDSPPPPFEDCLNARCTPAALASFDIAVWKCTLGRWRDAAACRTARSVGALVPEDRQPGLPRGDGAIVWDVDGAFTVSVVWHGAGPRRVAVSGRR